MTTRINPHRRLKCENVEMTLEIGEGRHYLILSLAYDEKDELREVAYVGRGKIGHGIDALLHELGIKTSRAIQGRNPDTGEVDMPDKPIVEPKLEPKPVMKLASSFPEAGQKRP